MSKTKYTKLYLCELNDLYCDFSSTKGMPASTKLDRCIKARTQENLLAKCLPTKDRYGNRYTVLSIEDYCNVMGLEYSSELESSKGDLIVMHDGKEILRIDLKVGMYTYVGTPDMCSLFNFGWDIEAPNYYYCCQIDGSCKCVFKANDLFRMVFSGCANVIVSYNRSVLSDRVNQLRGKVRLFKPKKLASADMTKLYNEDFVSSSTIEKLFLFRDIR